MRRWLSLMFKFNCPSRLNSQSARGAKPAEGIILLVVLGMLTFFSVLVAAYLVFSNQSRQSSFVIASRVNHSADVNELLSQGLMKLVRGTSDINDPFFGEDLLSDYYGRRDALDLVVCDVPLATTFDIGGGFIRVPMETTATSIPPSDRPDTARDWDDLYAGRIITFIEGPLMNESFRVLRSSYDAVLDRDFLLIELRPNLVDTPINETRITELLYNGAITSPGFQLRMNGVVRNSPGIGFDETDIVRAATPETAPATGLGSTSLPIELQPNHLGAITLKVPSGSVSGDFDESYDAADFNNWFLSHRHDDGRIIPSFHRPAVFNYVLNERRPPTNLIPIEWSATTGPTAPTPDDWRNLTVSLSRATFRPLPIAANQLSPTSAAINSRFTGSNGNFALRTPIQLGPTGGVNRLDQLAKALVGSPAAPNPWDVDNDGDGIPDSIWIDLKLPLVTSPEGKLLRPLIAPMIEDLGGRLNVNTTSNTELANNVPGVNASALWASSRDRFADPTDVTATNPANNARRFQGLGYGPAEISIPAVDVGLSGSPGTAIVDANILTGLAGIQTDRLQHGQRAQVTTPLPGRDGADDLDILRTGPRPALHAASVGYGYSQDPFGRSATAMGRNGQLVMAGSGVAGSISGTNEAIDDPYELDPSGRVGGDRPYTVEDLEPLLRANHFDLEMLTTRLRNRVGRLTELHSEFANAFTTVSVSSDVPVLAEHESNTLAALCEEFGIPITSTNAIVSNLLAPEFRLGRKLDVNRPFGNGVDDNVAGTNGFGVIDEPSELKDGIDDDGINGVDDPGELEAEVEAFAVAPLSGQTVPTDYQSVLPSYTHGVAGTTGRELLARHLYVLMMGLTKDTAPFPTRVAAIPFPTPAEQAAYKARRIAQWAVNVVDYRDPDSIMTRFAYDPIPLDGWGVAYDDNLDGTSDRFEGNANLTTHPTPSPIVWGVEAPELLLSETVAFHDVRVRDTEFDSSSADKSETPTPDNDTDQVRIPQGSLFVELYCPRAPVDIIGTDPAVDQRTKMAAPRELYDVNSTNGAAQLDLSRLAPAPPGGGQGAPVWRLAFSEPHYAAAAGYAASAAAANDPQTFQTTRPNSASFEPSDPDELDPAATPLVIDRYVWFNDFPDLATVGNVISSNAISDMTPAQVFFAPSSINGASRLLDPGQYLSLAPRVTTNLGSYAPAGNTPERPSHHRLVWTAGDGVVHIERDNTTRRTPALTATGSYTPAMPMVIGTFPPAGWSPGIFANNLVGLNVSEPMPNGTSYYPEPMERYLGTTGLGVNYPLTDAYVDIIIGGNTAPDTPLDLATGRIPASLVSAPTTGTGTAANPIVEPALGTIPQYCSVFLQRLADPLSPFNVVTNPYRTVDWMEIDLTVFSGEERQDKVVTTAPFKSTSRQRNGFIGALNANALFSYQTNDIATSPTRSINLLAQDFFSFAGVVPFESSLNFLNTVEPTANPSFNGFAASIGSLGAPNVSGNDRNLPTTPFSQHPWLNRPYASHLELMMVPATSQGRLFQEFTVQDGVTEPIVYAASLPATPTVADIQKFYGPFGHLFNFFHSQPTDLDAAQFSRLFDFVHTLPRFRGEVEYVNPDPLRLSTNAFNSLFRPPFNFHWNNLRLGQVNLNSLAEFPVWAGLMRGHLNSSEFLNRDGNGSILTETQLAFDAFLTSRRGYAASGGAVSPVTSGPPYNYVPSALDPNYPTEFAGVFRNNTDAGFFPTVRNGTSDALLNRRGVNGSILRASGDLTIAAPPTVDGTTPPLFVRGITQVPTAATSVDQNRSRNAFMQYQTLMRTPNLVSDNSQVFVVRLTLGLFEVDADTLNLGREYNEDIGQQERYEAMFIIDRSRPVGFIPGRDFNVKDVVLFERFYQ